MSTIEVSASDARMLTDQIKTGVEAIWELIKQAYVSRAWSVLGYSSWDDYCTREFGTSRIRIPREERQEVIASMREIGMSTRAIASATGAGLGTVARELARVPFGTPIPITGTDGKEYPSIQPHVERTVIAEVRHIDMYDEPEYVDAVTGEIIEPEPTPRKVTGLDGKTYTPPKQQPKPRRTPITDLFRTQSVNLDRVSKQMRQLANDDRWATNKTEIAARYGNDLRLAINALTDIYANLTNKE